MPSSTYRETSSALRLRRPRIPLKHSSKLETRRSSWWLDWQSFSRQTFPRRAAPDIGVTLDTLSESLQSQVIDTRVLLAGCWPWERTGRSTRGSLLVSALLDTSTLAALGRTEAELLGAWRFFLRPLLQKKATTNSRISTTSMATRSARRQEPLLSPHFPAARTYRVC